MNVCQVLVEACCQGCWKKKFRVLGLAMVRASLSDAKHSFRAHERWLTELVGKPARAEGIHGCTANKIAHGAAHKFRHPSVCCVAPVLAVRCCTQHFGSVHVVAAGGKLNRRLFLDDSRPGAWTVNKFQSTRVRQ